MPDKNQDPEQRARDQIDRRLTESGWVVQNRKAIDFSAGPRTRLQALPPLHPAGMR